MDKNSFCILLCEDAFKDDTYLEEKYIGKKLSILSEKEARGFAIEDNNDLYICWRGLYDLIDIFNNLANFNKEYIAFNNKLCGKVNGYIFKYYSLLRNETMNVVKEYLETNTDKDKRIYFTGYSLGASILLSALEIKFLLKDTNVEIITITFGSPKLGDKYFTKIFNEAIVNSLHIYDSNDIVCKYPKGISYYHMENRFKLRIKKQTLFQLFLNSMKRLFIKRDNSDIILKKNMYIRIHTVESYKDKMKECEISGC